MNFRFPKEEKLKSKKKIELLFEEGKGLVKFPVKVLFKELENELHTQAAFSAPKRNFKKAPDRNRIKRQMREAYRLHKHLLMSDNGKKFALLFLYISKDKQQYEAIEKAMVS